MKLKLIIFGSDGYLCLGVGPWPPEDESSSPSHIGKDIE